METPPAHSAVCPRCGYSLRALTVPRCPECGLTFAFEQWQSGRLYDPAPSYLDQCDLWQPHQVLLGGLRDLVRTMLRPGWVLRRLDPHGKGVAAVLAFLVGTLWLWLATTILLTLAATLHGGASPAAAAWAAALAFSPPVIGLGLMAGVVSAGVVLLFRSHELIATTPTYQLRWICHWVVGMAAYTVLPVGVYYVLAPELASGVPQLWPVLSLGPAILLPRTRDTATVHKRRWHPINLALIGVGLALLLGLTDVLLPRSLEPPIWAVF